MSNITSVAKSFLPSPNMVGKVAIAMLIVFFVVKLSKNAQAANAFSAK